MSLPLTDSFGREHTYLRLSLTERCNLRCTYCMPEEGVLLKPSAHYMTAEEVVLVAKEFIRLGVSKIRFTGGEPLVRKDAAEIFRHLKDSGAELAVTTNGVLLDRYADVFEECGIRSVNISIDTLDKERMKQITRRDEFDVIMNNIRMMMDRGFDLKLNAVLMKGTNDDEITRLVKFTEENPVQFRFIEFMPFDGNRWDLSKCVTHKEVLARVKEEFPDRVIRLQDGPNDTARHYKIDGFKGSFALISSVTNPFCDTCNRLRVTADGKMKNCLFSSGETDLLSALRAGEALEPLIRSSVMKKKEWRGGVDSNADVAQLSLPGRNRSMIRIGG